MNNISGRTKNVSLSNYTKEVKLYKEKLAKDPWQNLPVALREINNVFGRCFFLSTDELATVEQKLDLQSAGSSPNLTYTQN